MKYQIATAHLIPGTDVLRNKPGINDREKLAEFEKKMFIARLMDVPEGDLSTSHVKKIHEHLFQDVYEWAGTFRAAPMSKGSSRFCQPQFIEQEVDRVTKSIDVQRLKSLDKKEFIRQLSCIVGDLNAIHPFMEGNGRTIREYAELLCNAVGCEFDASQLRGETWIKASIESFDGDNARLQNILSRHITCEKKQV